MLEHEKHYRKVKAGITDAILLAQEADDQFLEWMLGLCLAETDSKLKAIVSAKPARQRRLAAESRVAHA